ncbi:TrkH family potassium uptake protein [Pseudoruegeria sp. HB172150]|uniref:TrkH family potassium uptake protein n=1 Tax=Pseudoruegeria sp. HB172150 TaxID=2721164 RepID=UPI001551BDC3|nr:potassium transporter TrkG [Pseudoruegeria sp. HB172150]
MREHLYRLPLLVHLMGIGAAAMLLPAAYATAARDWDSARVFLHSSLIFLGLTAMIGVAMVNFAPRRQARSHLLALLGAYLVLPVILAVPIYESVGDTRFLNAYFEMVSSLTTTGATIYDDPARLSGAAHLWRAMVGWMGGFLVWVTAIAILAPLNLGGYEVLGDRTERTGRITQIIELADAPARLRRYGLQLLPIYLVLTLVLWVALLIAGDTALTAICHAMSTLATSGISPKGGLEGAGSGFAGEVLIFLFFGFALSRRTFEREGNISRRRRLRHDPEIRMAVGLVVIVPVFLFLRHWWGAFEVEAGQSFGQGLQALWGSLFTVLSFLSTTGFVSNSWDSAQSWSGLHTPGLILMGLALIGGGVATTAGGVKLLRVYALYKHGLRELEKLVYPSSIGGSGALARYLRNRGAYIAWIFFMLFAITIAVVMLALSLTGLGFDTSVVLTIAALSNTGPLAAVAAEAPISYSELSDLAKAILIGSMVLGRLETLAIIALLNPEFWRS